jgi:hypothetical protein
VRLGFIGLGFSKRSLEWLLHFSSWSITLRQSKCAIHAAGKIYSAGVAFLNRIAGNLDLDEKAKDRSLVVFSRHALKENTSR